MIGVGDPSGDGSPIELHGTSSDSRVFVRRFGDRWVPIGAVRAGETASIRLPTLGSEKPWMVRSSGACLAATR